MTDEYLTREECEKWRDHYDERIEAAMDALVEHEKSIKNSGRWLVGLVATILIGYGSIAVVKSIHADDQQTAVDEAQNEQLQNVSESLAEAAASQARSSAILEGLVSQSAERKDDTDKELERNRRELDRHRDKPKH